ncbi:TonB-dependent siderophore receptor [Variovorax sp. GB1P17]|uniref:TonB-dependent siderophore receptor n=1 Tax=Variovorax sp. GB1P17 TaxID=3443740 RepID=UPI003F46EEA7
MTNKLIAARRLRADSFTTAALAFAVASALISMAGAARAQDAAAAAPAAAAVQLSLPVQPLAQSLGALSRQFGTSIGGESSLLEGRTAPAVRGAVTLQQALERVLAGSGLTFVRSGASALTVIRATAGGGTSTLPPVTVTADAEEAATGHVPGYIARRSTAGSKTDTPIIETPQSVSVVTSDFIEASGATRLKEALAYTPGINVSPWGADSRFDWTILRGFDAQTPGYYLDGLQLRNNNGWAIWQTENYGTERIEVLRGPASVLYGQNGPGGMINVVSKRPTQEPLRELQVQFGDNARRQVAGDFSGPLDAEGKVLYRLTGMVRDARLPGSGLPNDRTFLAPSLTWKPSGDTTLTLLSHYLRIRDGSSYGSFPEVGTLLPNPNGRFSPKTYTGDPNFDRFNQDQWMVGYLLEHRLNDTLTFRQNARLGSIKVDYGQVYNRASLVTVNPDNADDPANYRVLGRFPFASKEKARIASIDNQLQARLHWGDWQHTLLFGLDYQRSRNEQRTSNSGSVPDIDGYLPVHQGFVTTSDPWFDARTTLSQTGFYAQDQIKWGHWVATLGGRYDSARAVSYSHIDGTTTSVSDHKFTSRAGLVYLHPSGWAPYFSYSESFSPTVTINPETKQPLKPETGRQYEVGVRYQPVDRKDKYSAAIFDLRRRNYITYDADFVPRQTGEILVRGLELEASFQPVPRMNITAAYTYTPKAVVTASSTPSEIGKQMQAVSRNQVSVWADYRFATGVKVGLGARFMGSNHGYQQSTTVPVPSYTVFDALVGYDFERWSLALNLRNLGNTTYIANCSSGSCYYGEPRKVLATATYRW